LNSGRRTRRSADLGPAAMTGCNDGGNGTLAVAAVARQRGKNPKKSQNAQAGLRPAWLARLRGRDCGARETDALVLCCRWHWPSVWSKRGHGHGHLRRGPRTHLLMSVSPTVVPAELRGGWILTECKPTILRCTVGWLYIGGSVSCSSLDKQPGKGPRQSGPS
jgi:hypothetical protein